ncbi:hypothetical protein, partial [Streptomyces sp. ME18-1-4]|uniref:hypothetical protein n=1 Tax=Streptomyces sp. ME18-1-4 TaxID=3028685 RepID=UPI0029B850AC
RVGGGGLAVPGAAGGLAIHGHRVRATGTGAGQVGQAAGTDRVTTRRIVAGLGATPTPSVPVTRVPSRARACCGALADHWPIAAYERAGDHRRGGNQQHRHERVTHTAPPTRIGQYPQPLRQREPRNTLQSRRLDETD